MKLPSILANGLGPVVTADLHFTLTVDPYVPANEAGFIDMVKEVTSLDETENLQFRRKIAELTVKKGGDILTEGDFFLEGNDRKLFEIEGGVLYLKAGVSLDHCRQQELKVAIGHDGVASRTDLTLAVNKGRGKPEECEPFMVGVPKLGAQLEVKINTPPFTSANVQEVTWRRVGESEVLSKLEVFRVTAPGEYEVQMVYDFLLFNKVITDPNGQRWKFRFVVEPENALLQNTVLQAFQQPLSDNLMLEPEAAIEPVSPEVI